MRRTGSTALRELIDYWADQFERNAAIAPGLGYVPIRVIRRCLNEFYDCARALALAEPLTVDAVDPVAASHPSGPRATSEIVVPESADIVCGFADGEPERE